MPTLAKEIKKILKSERLMAGKLAGMLLAFGGYNAAQGKQSLRGVQDRGLQPLYHVHACVHVPASNLTVRVCVCVRVRGCRAGMA